MHTAITLTHVYDTSRGDLETPCGEDDEYSTDSGDYEGETHNDEFVDPSTGINITTI
jgi:hypothetical protein